MKSDQIYERKTQDLGYTSVEFEYFSIYFGVTEVGNFLSLVNDKTEGMIPCPC